MPANTLEGSRRSLVWSVGIAALVLITAILAIGVAGQAAPSVAAHAAEPLVSATPCGGNYTWHQVASPNVGTDHNILRGVGVVSTNDVWAVGYTDPSQETLIEHWNGTEWAVMPSPNVGAFDKLYGIAVIAANDIWAVGTYYDIAIFKTRPLTLHYDGSTWSVVPVNIDFGVDYVELMGVAAASSNEVIAVGQRSYNTQSTLALHWDGAQWREELSGHIPGCPGPPYVCSFYGVTAVGPNDAWAVGAIHNNEVQTLTAHWDGTTWTRVASPNLSQSTNYLGAVTNAGPDNVWAAGFYLNYDTGRYATLTMRWNGTDWVIVPSPNPGLDIGKGSGNSKPRREPQSSPDGSGYYPPSGAAGNMLLGISAAAPDEIWAVGSSDQVGDTETNTLIMRWNGAAWTVVPSANPSGFAGFNRLYAVDVVGRDDAWAAGIYWVHAANQYASLIERYNGNSCPTPTPVTPTATPTVCVGSPTWNIIPSADGPSTTNEIKAIGIVSPNDIWALGRHYNGLIGGLIEHWDGTSWTLVPNAVRAYGFEDIAVISADDIWAVGNGGGNPDGAVTAHWDGTSWTRIDIGIYGTGEGLFGVAAVATDDVWAVGYNDYGPLIMHWDGTSWSWADMNMGGLRPDKHSAPDDYLTRLTNVAVVAQDDIWAVGTIRIGSSNRTLTMHYDGTDWNLVGSPSPGTYSNVLEGVTAVSANDVWAVGYYANDYTNTPSQSLALHWNGTTWTRVTTPSPGFSARNSGSPDNNSEYMGTFLYDVTAVSATEIWAVGKYSPDGFSIGETVILRWNGSAWTRVSSPNPANFNVLYGVAAIAPNYVWAVGQRGQINNSNTLVMRYGPPCEATPFPTSTPRPPTSTAIVPTVTPGTAIPTISTTTSTPQPTSTAAPSFTPTPTPVCGVPYWHQVDALEGTGSLTGVGIVGPDNVWAVGNLSGTENLILHWDGTNWSEVAAPASNYSGLEGISVVSASDIWAVGYENVGGFFQPYTIHWNGVVWLEIATPRPFPTAHGYLQDVGAVSSNDVWAVGDGPTGPLTMHWDGTEWTIVPSPLTGNKYTPGAGNRPGSYDNSLFAVGVVSSNDVWAVGTRNDLTWAVHWNGTNWSQVSTPNPGSENSLTAITVINANDIWAVGHRGFYLDPRGAIALHWNGTSWTSVPPPTGNFGLFGVTAVSSNEVWAVGWEEIGQNSSDALILGWNGTSWTRVPSPNPSYSTTDELFAAGTSGPDDVWAVGRFDREPLTDRYSARPCSTPAPPTSTAVPPTATATSEATSEATSIATSIATNTATNTALPTALACAITYSDVPSTNAFYNQIMCLSCMGFVSGYSDGTFRPNNEITRGQLSKIVSNTAGFSDSPSQQTFADVAIDSTFYMYIERMAQRGVISGYPCGGPGEACGEGNKPYFRPYANATRGQISKVVANAANLQDAPSGQSFEDVPASHSFYTWVQRLAQHGMMSGYACGGVGEPCGTTNRPYFRPANNATRGQVSKIVSNGFYPGCQMR